MSFISEIDIVDEARDNFLTYASEVLTDRAIPSAEDGLLSSQRKLLWTMEDYLKMSNSSKTKKCNAIVGSTLATSYFHGDASCYGVLRKLSQDYLMRYPLVHGQGSLGTQENNDIFASSRYTEAKPSVYADLMMNDFKKDVVPLKETYNGEFMEPVVLPSLFPNALCNGRQTIGISMSHSSAPNNLTEVCDAIIAYIQKGKMTTEEIMEYIKGPDFPLPNVVINAKDIKSAFDSGHSNTSLKVRGVYEIKGQKIVFTSIPYRTYRNKIKEQIEKNIDVFDELLDDFNDESALGENRLVFDVKKNINPQTVVNKLFALTDLQTSISYNMNYIVDGTPKLCSIGALIEAYIKHQTNVLIAATEYDKDKAEKRKHILDGLLIIITSIDKAIALIRNSKDSNEAKAKLIAEFGLDDVQAKAVLDMKLAKLTKLDSNDLVKELEEKKAIIAECNRIIGEESYRNEKLIEKVKYLRNKYGDKRRTVLMNLSEPKEEKEIADVIPEDVVITVSKTGMVKRVPKSSFKVQKRGGVGVKSANEAILETISTNTVDHLMFFSSKGKMFRIVADEVPAGTNVSKGFPLSSILKLESDENIIAATALNRGSEAKYVIFFTKNGIIKKTSIEEYMKLKKNSNGLIAIKLSGDDTIANVVFANDEKAIVVTKKGMSIKIDTATINPIGRATTGVKGIKLEDGDEVIYGGIITKETKYLATFSGSGCGKKTSVDEFVCQGRGGKGILCFKSSTSDELTSAELIGDDDIILISTLNNVICISSKEIPLLGRTSMGNIVAKGKIVSTLVL